MKLSDILEQTGISEEEFLDRIVNVCVDEILSDGGRYETELTKRIEREAIRRIDAAITGFGDTHVAQAVSRTLEGFCLQETNQWGEKKGRSYTLTEYLVERAEIYLTEDVDKKGRNEMQCRMDRDYFEKHTTRIANMVNSNLHPVITDTVTAVLKDANTSLCKGIMATVRSSLEATLNKIKVSVTM